MYHSPVRSCILLLCSFKSRFSEIYFIHFTYGPMVIFDPLNQDFWSSLGLISETEKATTNLLPYSRQELFGNHKSWVNLVEKHAGSKFHRESD
jgi:hypothetical protein